MNNNGEYQPRKWNTYQYIKDDYCPWWMHDDTARDFRRPGHVTRVMWGYPRDEFYYEVYDEWDTKSRYKGPSFTFDTRIYDDYDFWGWDSDYDY